MSRWLPPQHPSRQRGSPYITPAGAQELQRELKHLWKIERPQVTAAVHEAAKNGDRSENADYIYGKRRLREIDSRVRFLSKRLNELKIVDRTPQDQTKIFFGAWVTLKTQQGNEIKYRIVGPDEFDISQGRLSMDSLLGKALLGKRIDEEVRIKNPQGEQYFYVSNIEY